MDPIITAESTKEEIKHRIITDVMVNPSMSSSIDDRLGYVKALVKELDDIKDKNGLLVFVQDELNKILEEYDSYIAAKKTNPNLQPAQ